MRVLFRIDHLLRLSIVGIVHLFRLVKQTKHNFALAAEDDKRIHRNGEGVSHVGDVVLMILIKYKRGF